MTQAGKPPTLPQGGKPAHIEVFDSAGSSDPVGEVWPAPGILIAELNRESSLLHRLGSAGLGLARGIRDIGKITMRGDLGEIARNLRQF